MDMELDTSAKRPMETSVQCDMCGKEDVKYRCPRCERITCSLDCCVEHKKQYDCNGQRDRTKYIPIKQFQDADLTSDYFFLEEVNRSTSNAGRTRQQLGAISKKHGQNKRRKIAGAKDSIHPDLPDDWISRFPKSTQLVVEHAHKRGVHLTLLAPGMTKRTKNTSYMDTKANVLYWRVEWDFPSADVPVQLFEKRANENQTLFELLAPYLAKSPENATIRSKLRQYATSSWEQDLVLLLRKEFSGTSDKQYYKLDGSQSVQFNLSRKSVVEFPIIHVIRSSDVDKYSIVHDTIEEIDASSHPATSVFASSEENCHAISSAPN